MHGGGIGGGGCFGGGGGAARPDSTNPSTRTVLWDKRRMLRSARNQQHDNITITLDVHKTRGS